MSLRAVVCGFGVMGRNHARVIEALDGIELVGIMDPALDADVWHDAPVVADLAAVVALQPDYCVVATPTSTHVEVASTLAAAGIACLIEKPLAPTAEDAAKIVEAFDRAGVKAAVGQIERFNPAIVALRERVQRGDIGEIYQIATRRLSPFPTRIGDVGVTMDLATHDLDLARYVIGSEYASAVALTRHKSGRDHEDLITIIGEFENAVVASHIVNWLSPMKERITVVTGDQGTFIADTLRADLTLFRNGAVDHGWTELAQFGGMIEGDMTRFAIAKVEPLRAEHEGFREVLLGSSDPRCSLADGLRTVAVADALVYGAYPIRREGSAA
jgi:UDP-N-acetylglucosamine 3-dehydrogenase